jgi:hypothetical protein
MYAAKSSISATAKFLMSKRRRLKIWRQRRRNAVSLAKLLKVAKMKCGEDKQSGESKAAKWRKSAGELAPYSGAAASVGVSAKKYYRRRKRNQQWRNENGVSSRLGSAVKTKIGVAYRRPKRKYGIGAKRKRKHRRRKSSANFRRRSAACFCWRISYGA